MIELVATYIQGVQKQVTDSLKILKAVREYFACLWQRPRPLKVQNGFNFLQFLKLDYSVLTICFTEHIKILKIKDQGKSKISNQMTDDRIERQMIPCISYFWHTLQCPGPISDSARPYYRCPYGAIAL